MKKLLFVLFMAATGMAQAQSCASLTVSAAPTPAICNGTSTGTITITASGGFGAYTYAINSGAWQSSNVFTGLPAGIYSAKVKDALGCTKDKKTVISERPVLVLNTSSTGNACPGDNNGTITLSATGGLTPYTFSIGGAYQSSGAFTGLSGGNYTTSVKDALGCIKTATVTVTQPAGLHITASKVNVGCYGESTGSVTFTVAGGTAPYTYSIGGAYQSSNVFTGLAAGSYTATIMDANGCSRSGNITLTQPTFLSITHTASNIVCNASNTGSITINASGGTSPYTYSIGGAYQSSNTFTGLGAGTYVISVKDQNNCFRSDTVVVTENPVITATINILHVACNGSNTGSLTVNASGGVAPYTYSIGGAYQSSNVFTGLAAGGYAIYIKDNVGCTKVKAAIIYQPGALTLTASPSPAYCPGSSTGYMSLSGSGGTAPYTYSIGGAYQPISLFAGLTAGTYAASVKDANGCIKTQNVTITSLSGVTAVASVTAVHCNGGNDGSLTITASGGVTPYLYSIGGSYQLSNVFTGLAAGNYTATVVDAAGCQVVLNKTITQPPALSMVTHTYSPVCPGGTGYMTINASGGTSPYSYSLGGTYQLANYFTGLTPGNYTITLKDANGCTVSRDTVVTAPTGFGISIYATPATCHATNTGSIDISVWGGHPPYLYSIGGASQGSGTFTGVAAGNYIVQAVDAYGCVLTSNATVTQPLPISMITHTYSPVCEGSTGYITINASGGTPPYSYALSGVYQSSNYFTGLTPGNYTITVKDVNGCTALRDTVVTAPPAMGLIATSTAAICPWTNTGTITLTPSGGHAPYMYYSIGGAYSSSNEFSGVYAGNYPVLAVDAYGCIVTGNVTVTEPPAREIELDKENISCYGDNDGSIELTVTGGTPPYVFSIDSQITYQSSGTYAGLAAGDYRVWVRDSVGCMTFLDIAIEPYMTINSFTGFTGCSATGGYIQVLADGGTPSYSYSIDPGGSPSSFQSSYTFLNLSAGIYEIFVKDAVGCVKSSPGVYVDTHPELSCSTSVINESAASANDGSASTTVTGGVSPYTYAWSPAGGTGSTATGLTAGTYTCQVTDYSGCTTTCEAVIAVGRSFFVDGIIQENTTTSFAAYPNPAQNQLNIQCSSSTTEKMSLQVVNAMGQLVHSQAVNADHSVIDVSGFAEGTYVLQVLGGKEQYKKVFVIQR